MVTICQLHTRQNHLIYSMYNTNIFKLLLIQAVDKYKGDYASNCLFASSRTADRSERRLHQQRSGTFHHVEQRRKTATTSSE